MSNPVEVLSEARTSTKVSSPCNSARSASKSVTRCVARLYVGTIMVNAAWDIFSGVLGLPLAAPGDVGLCSVDIARRSRGEKCKR